MKQLTINIDMDGVVYNMMGELAHIADRDYIRDAMEAAGSPLPENIFPQVGSWSIWESWGISKKAFWELFYLAIQAGLFLDGDAWPGAIETVTGFVKHGHRVRIVTSKQFSNAELSLLAQHDVLTWLNRNATWANKVEVVFAQNKQGYEADVIIDDKPTLAWAQKERTNVLFSQPWNYHVDVTHVAWHGPYGGGLYRADGWEDVEYLINKLEKDRA